MRLAASPLSSPSSLNPGAPCKRVGSTPRKTATSPGPGGDAQAQAHTIGHQARTQNAKEWEFATTPTANESSGSINLALATRGSRTPAQRSAAYARRCRERTAAPRVPWVQLGPRARRATGDARPRARPRGDIGCNWRALGRSLFCRSQMSGGGASGRAVDPWCSLSTDSSRRVLAVAQDSNEMRETDAIGRGGSSSRDEASCRRRIAGGEQASERGRINARGGGVHSRETLGEGRRVRAY